MLPSRCAFGVNLLRTQRPPPRPYVRFVPARLIAVLVQTESNPMYVCLPRR